MTCRILAELGISGLHHPAEAVRKMAEKILVLVYKSNPRLVRRQLPPDDEVTRRNILYRHLMQEFDKIDIEVTSYWLQLFFLLVLFLTGKICFRGGNRKTVLSLLVVIHSEAIHLTKITYRNILIVLIRHYIASIRNRNSSNIKPLTEHSTPT